MRKLSLLPILSVLLLSSCIKDVQLKTVRAGNKFLVDVPKSMNTSESVKPGAELQLAGDKDFPINFYGLSDEKAEQKTMGVNFTLEELYYLEADEVSQIGSDIKISIPKTASLSYLPCVSGDVYFSLNNVPHHCKLYVCEGGARFYRLGATGTSENMDKNNKLVKDIFESFREWSEFQAETTEK